MSDDLFTLDLSGMNMKELIQVVNEMDSKLNNKIIPEILEEVGDELIDEERRMLQGRSNKDGSPTKLSGLLTKQITKTGNLYKVKAGYDTATIKAHPESVIIEFGRPGKKSRKKGGKDKLGRKIGAVPAYSHIRAALISKKKAITELAENRFRDEIEELWEKGGKK